jgi:hypothetical protein
MTCRHICSSSVTCRERGHGAFVDLTVDGGRPNQTFGVEDAGHHQADVDAIGRKFQTQGIECCP